MKSIDKKALENLKEEFKDISENPAIASLLELKRKGDRGLILSNPADYPEMSEEEYVKRATETALYFKEHIYDKAI
jgi:hypothetical protein